MNCSVMFWYHLGQRPEAAVLHRGQHFLQQVTKNQKTSTLTPWWVKEEFKAGRESRQGALKKTEHLKLDSNRSLRPGLHGAS